MIFRFRCGWLDGGICLGGDGNTGRRTEDAKFGRSRADSCLEVEKEDEAEKEEEENDVCEIILCFLGLNASKCVHE
jgi:hypothetical protein